MEQTERRSPRYLSLRDAMNELFEGSFVSPRQGQGAAGNITPPVDVHETENGFSIAVALPGVEPDEIKISSQANSVTISGDIRRSWQREEAHAHYQEIEVGRFSRSFTLGDDVDIDKAEASFDNGVLVLHLPKAKAVMPKTIRVTTGAAQRPASPPIEGDAEAGSETRLENR